MTRMSNFDSDNKTQKINLKDLALKDFKKDSNLKDLKWRSLQTDLKSALSEWSDLNTEELKKTPEELQLDKVKSMIENIKEKLNQF